VSGPFYPRQSFGIGIAIGWIVLAIVLAIAIGIESPYVPITVRFDPDPDKIDYGTIKIGQSPVGAQVCGCPPRRWVGRWQADLAAIV